MWACKRLVAISKCSVRVRAGYCNTSDQEFSTLSDSATIYKLVGPILLKQDRTEAKMAVEGRLEFIGKEV